MSTLYKLHKALMKMGYEVEVPYSVYRVVGSKGPLSTAGDQITLGEDYVQIEDARTAIAWYVGQLGGSVTWAEHGSKK